ncbi:36076_t:CDS:2, partial [Racocetra persica]
ENFHLPILETRMLDLKQLYPLIILLKERELTGEEEAFILKKLIIYCFRRRRERGIQAEVNRSNIFWEELEEKTNLKD